jgi:sigma-B regulation protein RsbU (phosphoserine phosphatase)
MNSHQAVEALFWVVIFLALVSWFFLFRVIRLRRARDILIKQQDLVFSFIHDIGEVFSGDDEQNLHALLKRLLFYALRTSKAGAGAIYLVEPGEDTMYAAVSSGTFCPLAGHLEEGLGKSASFEYVEDFIRRRRVAVGEGLLGEVAERNQAILIRDAERDLRVPRHGVDFLFVQSLLIVPMRFHGRVLGVLAVMNRVDGLPFNVSDQELLQAVADQASVSVHFAAVSSSLKEKRRLDHDLKVAKNIQAALHPKKLPSYSRVEFGAFSMPAQEIGGDYYDLMEVGPDHLGIVIGDVSGKGISGALIMATCRSVLRMIAPGRLSPADVLKSLNAHVTPDLGEDMFISMVYIILNHKTLEMTMARAGHVLPLVFKLGDLVPTRLDASGIAIGLAPTHVFDQALEEKTFQLKKNDLLALYTDGVVEARNVADEEYQLDRLIQAIGALRMDGLPAADIAEGIEQKLLQFIGDIPQYDDMTLVTMRVS